ncbi:MBL fold metallo-hydrolase, partial [Streptomyces sp. NPDC049099]
MADDQVQSFLIGDVEVLRIIEWRGPHLPGGTLVPDCPPEVWSAHEEDLVPDHREAGGDRAVVAVQTWVV